MAMGPIMGSMLYTMMASGTVGQLAIRSFGSYDLPLPRHTDEVNLIASNLDSFATEWELERDDLVLWITTQELALHAALSRAAFGPQLEALLGAYVDASPTDLSTDAIRSMLGQDDSDPLGSDFDPNQFDPSNLAISPERLLGSLRSPEQEALRPRIDAAVAALEGWSGWVTDTVAERLMPGSSRVAEALRRRRVSVDPASRFVERLFGLELTQDVMDRGRVFVRGVLERADADVLTRLVTDPEAIPTPNELEAPGLWLARLGVEPDGGPEPDSDSLDVPDFPDL
jgi:putative hydrolase